VTLSGVSLTASPWPPTPGVPYILAFGGGNVRDWGMPDVARALAPDIHVYLEYRDDIAAPTPDELAAQSPAIAFRTSLPAHLQIIKWMFDGNGVLVDASGESRASFSINGPAPQHVDTTRFVRCMRGILKEP